MSSNEELRLRTVIPSLSLLWLITGTKKEFVSFTNNSAYYKRLFDSMILQNTDKNALNNLDMPDKKQSLVRPASFCILVFISHLILWWFTLQKNY